MVGSHTRSSDVDFDSIGNRAGDRKITYSKLGQKEEEHRWENKTRDGATALINTYEKFGYDEHGHLNRLEAYEGSYQTRLMTQENNRVGYALSQTDLNYEFNYNNGHISSRSGVKTTQTQFGYRDGRLSSQVVREASQSGYSLYFDYHFSGQMHQQRTVYHKDDGGVDTLTYAYKGRESFQKNTITANSTREGNGRGFKAGTTTYAYNSAGQLSGITSTREESERKHLTDFNGQIALQLDVKENTLLANLTTSGNPLATITKGKVDADLLDDSGS
ncbi:hypothetical protein, partial [Enterovibrio norvegicus]|uniref:hypothetical protein n=1 Tax=Enterovibrio norvegicus TaxID=188144 RepID=UPI001042106A